MARSGRRRRLLLGGAVALLGLVLAGEIGLRLYAAARGLDVEAALVRAHPEGGLYVPHPYVGFGLRPVPGSPDNNAHGLRGPEVPLAKPRGVVRILCLGGSTTYGSGVSADEAYPARLQALLADAAPAGTRYEVLNCGVPGYASAESLIALELRLLEFQPDGLVVYHGINDARLIQTRGFRPDYAHMRRAWRHPDISAVEWWLLRHSRAYAWLAHAMGFGLKSIRLEDLIYVDDAGSLFADPREAGVNQAGVHAFLRNVGHIVTVARAHGIEPLLATFATRELPGGARPGQEFAPTLAAMNGGLAGLASREGVPLADLARAFAPRPELFYDNVHFNARGTQAQAEAVLRAARDAGLWGLR
jgi:lysophospholipase L1-like esterase